MHKITSTTDLKEAIVHLEYKQKEQWIDLKENIHMAVESLKPVNLIKSTYKELLHTPNLTENLIGSTIGLGTGFITRKLIIRRSGNILQRLVGGLAQKLVTNIVSRNIGPVKLIGAGLLRRLVKKRKTYPSHV